MLSRESRCTCPSSRWDMSPVGLDCWAFYSRPSREWMHHYLAQRRFFGAAHSVPVGSIAVSCRIFSISRLWKFYTVSPAWSDAEWAGLKLGSNLILCLAMLVWPRFPSHMEEDCVCLSKNLLQYSEMFQRYWPLAANLGKTLRILWLCDLLPGYLHVPFFWWFVMNSGYCRFQTNKIRVFLRGMPSLFVKEVNNIFGCRDGMSYYHAFW